MWDLGDIATTVGAVLTAAAGVYILITGFGLTRRGVSKVG